MPAADRLVWIDLEMTGLNPKVDEIVEVACIVTEADLTEVDAGINLVVQASPAALEGMDPFVRNMHAESGLLEQIPHGVSLEQAQRQVLEYVASHVPEPKKAPLAGSSVYVDRGFIGVYMPLLDDYLHYRLVDVSTVKEVAKRWYPRVYFASPEKHGNHRALGDIRESIAELRYYRDAIFVDQPGPDSKQAKAIGRTHVVDHGLEVAVQQSPEADG